MNLKFDIAKYLNDSGMFWTQVFPTDPAVEVIVTGLERDYRISPTPNHAQRDPQRVFRDQRKNAAAVDVVQTLTLGPKSRKELFRVAKTSGLSEMQMAGFLEKLTERGIIERLYWGTYSLPPEPDSTSEGDDQ